MKIVEINSVCGVGSTGRICVEIAEVAKQNDHECLIAYGRSKAPREYDNISYRIGSNLDVNIHALKSRLFGKTGTYSKRATKKFLAWLDEYKPDVLHLHNLHGFYVNVPLLFDYIKKNNIRTIWTLHDCWSFTGHCSYFDSAECEKWKSSCALCPQKASYPKSMVDDSSEMFALKKEWFTGVEDLTIVTPSKWLAELVSQSFLKTYPIKVVYNGIDLDAFKPIESDIRQRLGCEGKKLIFGAAFQWGKRKGLDVFIELSKRLNEDYKIVLVGVDRKHRKKLPKNVIAIARTNSQKELAELYSAADVFVNPTREEVLGMVNIESLACGTPVITFATGGSPETINDNCGIVVEKDDVDGLERSIKTVCETATFAKDACVRRAMQFDAKEKYYEYIKLYEAKK